MYRHRNQVDASRFSMFEKACTVLCLLLLLFSVGHSAVGHSGGLLAAPHAVTAHQMTAPAADSADTCAVCVAIATAIVLAVLAFGVPRTARLRPQTLAVVSHAVSGWHHPLFCRPPPAL